MSSNSLFQIEIVEEKGIIEIIPSEEFASMTRYEQILAVEEQLASYEAELKNINHPVGSNIINEAKSCQHEDADKGRIEFRILILQNFLQRLIDMNQDGNTE
ncbi:hypothetical protein SAMN04489760_1018 [Syntrophus gentianae]|uniref:Uncharacterized protein n=1 Tax=Syntrophus gentianae TaxID=43775 RepID=A0A1H7U7W0_9BACT|nr:hypothetical protein [Syntrophus gentianae]SEL92708.1 hypothetical protein SAMN04489760_1018 [Syntrophus gentianae]